MLRALGSEQLKFMVDMNDYRSCAQGFKCFQQLEVMDYMNDSRS